MLVLVGPTASGKTEVAYEISKLLTVEMISCDSMQVYQSMSVLTQAPSEAIVKALHAHLVSFLPPEEEYNASLFRRDAALSIELILKNKKIPMIVGGTGLYLRALLDGLFESEGNPLAKDERFREELTASHERHGGDFLYKKLSEADPLSAAKIHPNDIRRIIRTLEVCHLTGKPASAQRANRKGIREETPHRIFLLDRPREDLYGRIDRRVDLMVKEGLVDEVKSLLARKLSLTAGMALGIKEIKGYLEGRASLEEAVELLKKNTRNYAKRQLTWFRHEKGVELIPINAAMSSKNIAEVIVDKFKRVLS